MRSYRNDLKLRYQVVCALSANGKPFSETEIPALREAFASSTRTLHCLVEAFKVGDRWIEARVSAEPGFDLSRMVQVVKSTTSRRLHLLDASRGAVWAEGYAAFTLGQEMDAAAAAAKLSSTGNRKEPRP